MRLLYLTISIVFIKATPPPVWQENWYEHKQLLRRVHYDDDVAVYFDRDMDDSITWINPFLNNVWSYVKKVYGNFGDDPVLYGIFHVRKYSGCHSTSYFDLLKKYKNVIDCGTTEVVGWKHGKKSERDLILGTVSLVVQTAAHGVCDNPAFAISGHYSDHIIVYDIYLGLNRTKDAQRWRQKQLINKAGFPKTDTFWFRDWFLPIYERHGGSLVLDRFFKLTAKYMPKSNTASFNRPAYSRDMTYGEFFHFWSGAAGRSLKKLATTAFDWLPQYEKEFLKAQKDFPEIKYFDVSDSWQEDWFEHKESLTLHFSDNHVAIYFDKDVDKSIVWLNTFLHDVWSYIKKVYGDFGEDPLLYGIFHTGKYEGGHPSTYFDSQMNHKNVIDCGRLYNNAWQGQTTAETDIILKNLAMLVQYAAHGVHTSPAFPLWGWTFIDIFVYDIYLNLNRTDDANRWYDIQFGSYQNSPNPKTYWFRDWFLPVYERYGGSYVLDQFFLLLSKYFPKDKARYSRDMNLGEFVHFWSGAAQISLKGLAVEAFGWNEELEKQFKQATEDFPHVIYYNIVLL